MRSRQYLRRARLVLLYRFGVIVLLEGFFSLLEESERVVVVVGGAEECCGPRARRE